MEMDLEIRNDFDSEKYVIVFMIVLLDVFCYLFSSDKNETGYRTPINTLHVIPFSMFICMPRQIKSAGHVVFSKVSGRFRPDFFHAKLCTFRC